MLGYNSCPSDLLFKMMDVNHLASYLVLTQYDWIFFKVCYKSRIMYDEIGGYLLSTYYGQHTGRDAGGTPMNTSGMLPVLPELVFHQRRQILV